MSKSSTKIESNTTIKGDMTNEQLLEYLDTTFKERVIKFNTVCGKGVNKEASPVEVLGKAINQAKRVLEESVEALVAYQNNDTIERLDALVDILVTKVMYEEYLIQLSEIDGESLNAAIAEYSTDDVMVLDVVQSILSGCITAAQGVAMFLPKRIYISCELILANNEMKYTTDVEKMEEWKKNIDEETHFIREVDYEGDTYYSIIRKEDEKIQKPFDFKEVNIDVEDGE